VTSRSTGLALAILAGAVTSCVEPGPEDPPRAPSPEGPCDRADFNFAPAPRDGTAVGRIAPIDISDLQAEVTVAVADAALHVAATLDFVAPPDGRPVLQFHPTADALLLDGDAIALIPLLVSTPARALVALPDLEPCSAHTLTMQYSVPESALADAPLPTLEFEAGTVWWSSAQDDGVPNAMLERMLPSNLLFDRHPITLDVTLDGAGEDHALVANGLVEERDTGWLVTLPSRQPHGSFWVLYPTAGVSRLDRVVALPGERDVTVELYAFDADAEVDLTANADLAEATLLEYDETLGPYLHGDRYLGWLRSDLSVSMEYEGATLSTPGALQHEMAHSWYARGIAPVSEFHGWIDEGMATWVTGENPYFASQVPTGTAGLRLLVGEDAWSAASLDLTHYLQGALVLGGVAWQVGPERMLASLRDFYGTWGQEPITTEDLERHLYCDLGDPYVLDVFHNRVRGLDGYPELPDLDWCAEP